MKLKQKILYPALVTILIFVALVFYRLAGRLLEPVNLFHMAHGLWILLLLGWAGFTVYGGLAGRQKNAGQGLAANELFNLAGCCVLLMAGFLLAGQGRLLAGNQVADLFPFHLTDSTALQSLAAGGMVVAGLGLALVAARFKVPGHNPALLPLAAMLAGLGLILLFRLGPDIAELRHRPAFTLLFWRQFRSFLISVFVFAAALWYFTPARLEELTRLRYVYGLASIILISITAVIGTEMHGRRLALNLGLMQFQTVELVKLLALFFMVGYFRYEGRFLEPGRNRFGLPRGRYLLPYLFMWVLVLLPIFLQRDLGPTMLIFSLFLVIFYLGTGSALSVLGGIVLMGAAGGLSYVAGVPSMVRTRVDMWLDPFHYSQNIAEALWAAASGGLLGKGTGMGLAHRIPVVQSDFNFSVIAEEWGLIGVLAVLVIFAGLAGICLQAARRQEHPWQQLLAAGLGSLWILQTVVIIGGNMALLPLTGITLPFISYGGSSLVMNCVMLALALRLSANSIREKPTPEASASL